MSLSHREVMDAASNHPSLPNRVFSASPPQPLATLAHLSLKFFRRDFFIIRVKALGKFVDKRREWETLCIVRKRVRRRAKGEATIKHPKCNTDEFHRNFEKENPQFIYTYTRLNQSNLPLQRIPERKCFFFFFFIRIINDANVVLNGTNTFYDLIHTYDLCTQSIVLPMLFDPSEGKHLCDHPD